MEKFSLGYLNQCIKLTKIPIDKLNNTYVGKIILIILEGKYPIIGELVKLSNGEFRCEELISGGHYFLGNIPWFIILPDVFKTLEDEF